MSDKKCINIATVTRVAVSKLIDVVVNSRGLRRELPVLDDYWDNKSLKKYTKKNFK